MDDIPTLDLFKDFTPKQIELLKPSKMGSKEAEVWASLSPEERREKSRKMQAGLSPGEGK